MNQGVPLAEAASGHDLATGLRAVRALHDLTERLEALQVSVTRDRGWSLGHHLPCGHRYGARCRDSAGAGVTVCAGRRKTARMTPPPPVSPGTRTGNRETRRRAPVSDRPVAVLLAGSSLPP